MARANTTDMNTMQVALHALTARLAEIDAEAEHIRALISIYGGSTDSRRRQEDSRLNAPPRGQPRGVPVVWQPIAHVLIDRKDSNVDLAGLDAFARQNGLDLTKDQIRGQMHNWKNRGWVESPKRGVFRITPIGLIKMAAGNDDGADDAAPSDEIESSDEPEAHEAHRFDLLNPQAA